MGDIFSRVPACLSSNLAVTRSLQEVFPNMSDDFLQSIRNFFFIFAKIYRFMCLFLPHVVTFKITKVFIQAHFNAHTYRVSHLQSWIHEAEDIITVTGLQTDNVIDDIVHLKTRQRTQMSE